MKPVSNDKARALLPAGNPIPREHLPAVEQAADDRLARRPDAIWALDTLAEDARLSFAATS
jgi:hypothetical protein